ncbi:metallophosphoesterase family protein [Algoriphagus chordae]|uniref:Calcineurin-like phosphoesterase family protein n=1 Tax=Algoriphagus chordae TaxID=237019 RepID=A0A2W7QH47_9BACT|nr:metallophosphoesterase [Algoriphagus chordae]PZX47583.1 calcineurin-like phosphoesterase family protein [Algoriphagus chordae]
MQLVCANSHLLAQSPAREIAFLSDIHLQDVYADLHSEDFKGVNNPRTGKFATIRTMKSQLNSTRLFNENYFAFIAALEDLKKKGIQLVVLPGDFTDDGQPMNVLALQKILDQYAKEAGMRFFLTTGNHDPVKPFGGVAGKSDFLGVDGSAQTIAGSVELYNSPSAAISDQVNYWGYSEITQALAAHGFFPSEKDIFWAHPFQELNYDNYNFDQAQASSKLENRVFPAGDSGLFIPDASYVVEPVDGIWLLALDGNVYTHSGNKTDGNWKGSSVGFNQAAIHKKHQLDWIKKVSDEAEKRGKTLISFSHYPLVEFHDGASDEMKSLFGSRKFQLERVPSTQTSELYAKAGIKIHFAGHMHINDTGLFQDQTTNTMYNIQVPSLAAFPPAYKTLKTTNPSQFEIETISLTEVDHMNEFFDLYRMEHRWLLEKQDPGIWDSTILASKDYLEYTRNHLLELTKSRFIPSDWPENLVSLLTAMSNDELIAWSKMTAEEGTLFLDEILKSFDLTNKESASIIDDFYLLKNGDEIGKKLIPEERINFYEELLETISQKSESNETSLNTQLLQFFGIFNKLFHSLPSDHFSIDLKNNTIKKIQD